MTIQERVRRFIVDNFYVADPAELSDAASLIQGGWVDSTGMLELIAFLETEFRIRITDAEMVPDNLGSIERISAFVAAKSALPASA